jgi:hypothetical protein
MSGWTKMKVGKVSLEHYSTSSSVKLTLTSTEEIRQGISEEVTEDVWFDYEQIKDLKEALNEIDLI